MAKTITPGIARGNQTYRADMLAALFGPNLTLLPGDKPDDAYLLGRIERTLSRYTGSQQTAFDRGSTASAASASSGQMANQVDRAIAQVLGKSPGSSSDSFVQALASAFPTGSDGQVATLPQRSAVQIFTAAAASSSDGYNGLLSSRQATLARQVQLIVSDAMRVLAAIQPFDPRAEMERVEALRALCGSLITTIVSEVTRVDQPRAGRLDATFAGLDSAIDKLGKAALLNDPTLITTADDESRTAGFGLFKGYAVMMNSAWTQFKQLEAGKKFSLSEILERVNVELPVLARSATSFADALNSVGFVVDSDGRSRSDLFTSLKPPPPTIPFGPNLEVVLPALTPYDLSDWLLTFSGQEGPGYLASSGIFGLDFVGDQADTLFWTVAPILWWLVSGGGVSLNGDPTLMRLLTDERVRWSLDDLLVRVDTVADLVAAAEKP